MSDFQPLIHSLFLTPVNIVGIIGLIFAPFSLMIPMIMICSIVWILITSAMIYLIIDTCRTESYARKWYHIYFPTIIILLFLTLTTSIVFTCLNFSYIILWILFGIYVILSFVWFPLGYCVMHWATDYEYKKKQTVVNKYQDTQPNIHPKNFFSREVRVLPKARTNSFTV